MLTTIEKKQIVSEAVDALLSHEESVFAVISSGNEFNSLWLLAGGQLPIVKFNLIALINLKEVAFDESNFKWSIIFHKETKNKDPWFVIIDQDNNYITSSQDTYFSLYMTIFADDKTDDVPYCIKACFDNQGKTYPISVVATAKDRSISELWCYEANGVSKSLRNSNIDCVTEITRVDPEERSI